MEEQKTTQQPIKVKEENEIEKLRKKIALQYAELDAINNTLNTATDQKYAKEVEHRYWVAGIEYRSSIVYAFSLLDDLKDEEKRNKYLEWKKILEEDPRPFPTLTKAKKFMEVTRELLKHLIEETNDIGDALLVEEI